MRSSNGQGVPVSPIIISGLIISLGSGGLVVYAHYDAVRPGGSWTLLSLSVIAVLPLLVCLIAAPTAALCCLWRQFRRTAAALFLSSLFVFGTIYSSIRVGSHIRHRAFVSLAERSAVVVNAIKGYENRYGEPPESLSTLVPEFIPAIPQTGMGAYPNYEYIAARESMYDGNPWVLIVSTPTGIPDFDQFMYYPLQNYPAAMWGNPLERIRDWAYLHE